MQPRVSIQSHDFDLGAEVAALRAGDPAVGAVASFIGTVRDRNGGGAGEVSAMELEHYPGMTEKRIEAMIDAAMARFDIRAARVVHRVGAAAAGRADRAGGGEFGAPRPGLPGLRVPDGLPEDPGAVLEEGNHRRGRTLGGRACGRRRTTSVHEALQKIAGAETGVLVMLHRGETSQDLLARATLDAGNKQSAQWDPRSYGIGAQILRDLNVGKMRLLATPHKMPSMAGFGLEVVGYASHE